MSSKGDRFYTPIPHSIRRSLTRMSGDEVKQYLMASMDYQIDGKVAADDMSPAATIAYDVTIDLIDRQAEHAAKVSKVRSEARKKSGQAKQQRDDSDGSDDDDDDEQDDDPDPAPPQRPAAAAPPMIPTADEVQEYAEAHALTSINPQRFLAYCELQNWTYKGKPINWQSYATYLHNKEQANAPKVTAQQYTQREYSKEFMDGLHVDLTAEAKKLAAEQEQEPQPYIPKYDEPDFEIYDELLLQACEKEEVYDKLQRYACHIDPEKYGQLALFGFVYDKDGYIQNKFWVVSPRRAQEARVELTYKPNPCKKRHYDW